MGFPIFVTFEKLKRKKKSTWNVHWLNKAVRIIQNFSFSFTFFSSPQLIAWDFAAISSFLRKFISNRCLVLHFELYP